MPSPFTTKAPTVGPLTDRQRSYLHSLVVDLFKASDMTPETRDEMISKLPTLNRQEASELIEELKLALSDARKTAELEDGFYEYENTVYKVVHAVNGSGRQYAKALDLETGEWAYAPGAIKTVTLLASKLTLDKAKELGQLYGMCVRCGRTLTDETSIAAGIGPICAGRF